MLKKIKVEDAIGTMLVHDITEVNLNRKFKGRAFKKGHIITTKDVHKLLNLGKENLYVLEIAEDELHENKAALLLARAIAGKGIHFSDEVSEGKTLTTPSVLNTYRHIYQAVEAGCEYFIMEVSSHAIEQRRIEV